MYYFDFNRNDVLISNKFMTEYVLLTEDQNYFVEYLIGELVVSNSITEAMTFDDEQLALRFKQMLHTSCQLITSVNTYIK